MAVTTPSAFASRLEEAATLFADQSPVRDIALQVEALAKDQISGPLRAIKTGTLRRDISSRVDSATTARVGNNVNYAPHVHEGTRVMRGRPYLKRALEILHSSGRLAQLLTSLGQRWLDTLAK